MMDASMAYLRQFVPDVLAAVRFAAGRAPPSGLGARSASAWNSALIASSSLARTRRASDASAISLVRSSGVMVDTAISSETKSAPGSRTASENVYPSGATPLTAPFLGDTQRRLDLESICLRHCFAELALDVSRS
jgi:hypothetical protein